MNADGFVQIDLPLYGPDKSAASLFWRIHETLTIPSTPKYTGTGPEVRRARIVEDDPDSPPDFGDDLAGRNRINRRFCTCLSLAGRVKPAVKGIEAGGFYPTCKRQSVISRETPNSIRNSANHEHPVL